QKYSAKNRGSLWTNWKSNGPYGVTPKPGWTSSPYSPAAIRATVARTRFFPRRSFPSPLTPLTHPAHAAPLKRIRDLPAPTPRAFAAFFLRIARRLPISSASRQTWFEPVADERMRGGARRQLSARQRDVCFRLLRQGTI